MKNELALFGGDKTFDRQLLSYNPFGPEEETAALEVIRSGKLSGYIGAWCPDFYGGPRVQTFEARCCEYFGVEHAVAVNSLTSGLICAVGATGIEPGDEVIVSPWTMSASATAILVWNGIPVFADIEADTFNLDPASIEANISPRTRAIVVPSIFGGAARLDEIVAIAAAHNLKVIEDAAQAPGVRYGERLVGTLGDIGGFSLNYHKHIHTGEGGICVTDDGELAERMRLIRNHAEAVVEHKGETNLVNMIGFNFRLGEIEAAIGAEQLRKLDAMVTARQRLAGCLSARLRSLPGLRVPEPLPGSTHAYYLYGMTLDLPVVGASRERILAALRAEGVPALTDRYVTLHRYPMYRKRIAYGSRHFPWVINGAASSVSYDDGICPVAESLDDRQFLGLLLCQYAFDERDIDSIATAFEKVWACREQL
ncbi:DegT/DnrJ/EryC1/StrS family aminotransferase [Exilibacterium tricleocarpae]|uniref:DegT/DnrJ/EryC1/StrS family aminotransferase n=1 Tax=Exilibacterium tricleocarpae TaxID=2591008 RepID=A0A545U3U6_9GAMM|nr:DegT/DnrJ/EryC1/StrS family aminotransferase [Exilibacterium tricleocarpae]TQV84151.1 DegT/DnrJ/EryC1/StrS family aminotransferase [Exilibacterium tricleocarpae]